MPRTAGGNESILRAEMIPALFSYPADARAKVAPEVNSRLQPYSEHALVRLQSTVIYRCLC